MLRSGSGSGLQTQSQPNNRGPNRSDGSDAIEAVSSRIYSNVEDY